MKTFFGIIGFLGLLVLNAFLAVQASGWNLVCVYIWCFVSGFYYEEFIGVLGKIRSKL